jgi:7,8-dihydropterin-6-yl-methyl-4-(beta-D-ribofuranosyl)aminobenzene 5'-phosphate synthase
MLFRTLAGTGEIAIVSGVREMIRMRARTVVALVVGIAVCAVAVTWLVRADSDRGIPRGGGARGLPDAGMSGVAVTLDKGAEGGIPLNSLSLVIAYDNNPYVDGLDTEWGFSCLVSGPDKTILFDTGGEGDVLMANVAELGLDPTTIDAVVLSHEHRDHTGGLGEFLRANPNVTVYVPKSFDDGFKRRLEDRTGGVIEVEDAMAICKDVYSTGEMGVSIKEQGLVVRTSGGLIVVTGCAHPGIVAMVERAASIGGRDVLLVIGGFHLVRYGEGEIADVIAGLKNLGVKYAAPCHCSGDLAREMFSREFQERYLAAGVGRRLTASDFD